MAGRAGNTPDTKKLLLTASELSRVRTFPPTGRYRIDCHGTVGKVERASSMRALLQRVTEASVSVEGRVVGRIGPGLVILVGIADGDTEAEARWVAEKCVNLRIFSDEDGKFNLSALDVRAELLVISQFTLYGDTRKGRRPGFTDAAPPEISEPLYRKFVSYCRESGLRTETGRFGAAMRVHLVNDGPVTLFVEREHGNPPASAPAPARSVNKGANQ